MDTSQMWSCPDCHAPPADCWSLFRAYRNDEADAADQLARRFSRLVQSVVARVLDPHLSSETEDAAQEAWIRVFKGIGCWRGDVPLCRYLAVIVMHSAIDFERKECRRQTRLRLASEDVNDQSDVTQNPCWDASLRELESRLKVAVRSMPYDLQEVWQLYWQGCSNKEIAKRLGASLRTVQWRLAKIRNRLEECVQES